MKQILFLIIFHLLMFESWAVETKGKLVVDTQKTEHPIVGEAYSAQLTLVPFEEQMLPKSALENQHFLDYFYVTRVKKIKRSENNVDALVVDLDLVITKGFKNQTFKIWSLGSRNIPVSFSINNLENTDLLIKKFITFETSLDNLGEFNLKMIAILVLLIGLGVILYQWLRKRGVVRKKTINFQAELEKTTKHSDYEWLYRNRRVFEQELNNKEKASIEFNELMALIEKYQFQPIWKDMNISELNSKKNRVLELYKNGV